MKISILRAYLKFGKWGKYLITILVFMIVFLFVGEQSLVQCSRRKAEIKKCKMDEKRYQKQTENAQRMLLMLSNRDSLERYARELYLMHEENEEIYIIGE